MDFIKIQKIIVFISLAAFTSCSSSNYINSPAAHNPAFLREKNDLELSFSGALNSGFANEDKYHKGHSYGLDASGAYAISNHFYFSGGVVYRNDADKTNYYNESQKVSTTGSNKFDRYLLTLGGGYYLPIRRSGKVYMNIDAGIGIGKINRHDSNNGDLIVEKSYDINYIKYHLFPYFNFYANDYFRVSFAPRFYLANYFNGKTNNQLYFGNTLQNMQGKTMCFLEPSVLFQTALKKESKFRLNFGLNLATDPFGFKKFEPTDEGFDDMRSRNFLFTAGISFYPFLIK